MESTSPISILEISGLPRILVACCSLPTVEVIYKTDTPLDNSKEYQLTFEIFINECKVWVSHEGSKQALEGHTQKASLEPIYQQGHWIYSWEFPYLKINISSRMKIAKVVCTLSTGSEDIMSTEPYHCLPVSRRDQFPQARKVWEDFIAVKANPTLKRKLEKDIETQTRVELEQESDRQLHKALEEFKKLKKELMPVFFWKASALVLQKGSKEEE